MKKENQDWCYDHFINYRGMRAAKDIREQLLNIMLKQGLRIQSRQMSDPEYYPNIRKCILSGYFLQVAHL